MSSQELSAKNPFLQSAFHELCITCSVKIDNPNSSISDILLKSEHPTKFFDVVKFLSNFSELSQEQCPQYVCDRCFYTADMVLHFQKLCNNSAQMIKEYIIHQTDNVTIEEDVDRFGVSDSKSSYTISRESETNDNEPSFEAKKRKNKELQTQKINEKTHPTTEKLPKVECDICHKLLSPDYIKMHQRIHTGLAEHACKICGMQFRNLRNFQRHEAAKHQKNQAFLCSECGKVFQTQKHLNRHSISHKEGRFICNICNKRFRKNFHLKEHYSKHTGEKPFLCDECPKSFGTQKHLKQHQVTHAKVKPIHCEHCGRGFTQRHALRSHLIKACTVRQIEAMPSNIGSLNF